MVADSRITKPLVLAALLVVAVTLCPCQLWCAIVPQEQLRVPDSNRVQILTLNDGSRLTGRITKVEGGVILFKSQVGELSISAETIVDIKEVSRASVEGGKYWFPNPNQTRLYFAPTGRMLEAGKGYFSDIWIFFPSIAYGFTDNFSMSTGMSLFPGVPLDLQLYYFLPRIGFKLSEEVAVAGSLLIIRIPDFDGDDDRLDVGVLFSTCTIGPADNNVTFGLGHGYVGSDFADKPAVLIGGQWRFARRMSFVSENWVFPGLEDPLISYGIRFIGESISVDLGLFNVASRDIIFPGMLYIGFTSNF